MRRSNDMCKTLGDIRTPWTGNSLCIVYYAPVKHTGNLHPASDLLEIHGMSQAEPKKILGVVGLSQSRA